MKSQKKTPFSYHEHDDCGQIQACSAMDCTGLIPALPENEDQLESYEDLYPFMAKAEKDTQKIQ